MRATADANDVLAWRAPESDDDVPGLAGDGARRGDRERQQAHQPPAADDPDAPHRQARRDFASARTEDVHIVPARRQPRGHASQVGLRAATGELAVHERDPHHSPGRSRSQSARRR